jgi:hypothetical protein
LDKVRAHFADERKEVEQKYQQRRREMSGKR